MMYLLVIGGTKVHEISLFNSFISVAIPVVIGIVIIVGSIIFIFIQGGLSGDSYVMSDYNFNMILSTDSKLENLTFYTPLPLFNNESKLGERAIIQSMGSSEDWDLSMIETEHGIMLKITAIELVPEFNQVIELNPSDNRPTGEGGSFYRGSIEVYVSMSPDNIIDTRNATDNEPLLYPKYNMILSDYPYPSSGISPKTQSYESFIYADYIASPDANVEICMTLYGTNQGAWGYNSYSDNICTAVKGEKHGWIPVTGKIIEGEGRYLQ